MHEDLGWSIAQITGAYSLALLISGLAAILFGRWLDRHGPRTLMTAGSVLAAVLALGTIPIHALMLRQHPRDMGLLADGASILEADTPATVSIPRVSVTLHDALRERVFWWIMALCTTAARAIAPVGAGLLYTVMKVTLRCCGCWLSRPPWHRSRLYGRNLPFNPYQGACDENNRDALRNR